MICKTELTNPRHGDDDKRNIDGDVEARRYIHNHIGIETRFLYRALPDAVDGAALE